MRKLTEKIVTRLIPETKAKVGLLERELDALRLAHLEYKTEFDRIQLANSQKHEAMHRLLQNLMQAHHLTHERVTQLRTYFPSETPPSWVVAADQYKTFPVNISRPESERYSVFERYFYNTDAVSQNQRVYIPYFPKIENNLALDLGCGRGEFLQILSELGWSARGVDSNDSQCQIARSKGLDASCLDLFATLQAIPAGSIGLVSALQVVEHLAPQDIRRLLKMSFASMASSATIILETMNPICPFALSHFWQDETHVRPVSPGWLEFCLAELGFTEIKTVYQNPIPTEWRTANALTNYFNYAVIASKR